ncbi:cation transporter [Streptomyces mobaraensis NBRC 13819 = DSM 40847]|uniref:Cation transporter n=1 Tax=Streptomyces mobaraensis TaxID=35621 RepID=A0A5N5W2R6_STRMB|nr:cation diffusion facilitator family transporter [Streptomyces mobaraensis]KAB7836971.1 cation transporter [Streptomyces mobaraensis]QTT72608.1 cation transporter [Streptomyces mobaraensis NBRC 13819 = DSM 40847]
MQQAHRHAGDTKADGEGHRHDSHDGHDHDHGHGHGHGHGHHHGHGHGGHSHGVAADADRRWLSIALGLILAYMAVEVVVAFLAHSLALISDAAHMLSDAGSIVLALVAMRLAARPAKGGYTYGLKRAEILSAQGNGLTLLLLSAWLAYESVERLIDPPEVGGGMVLATAVSGVVVNIAAAWCMSKANRSSLNVEGAFQHIITDLYGFIATAVAGAVVMLTGFTRADSIATLVVVALMLRSGISLVRASGRIFLEAAPPGMEPDEVGARMARQNGVVEVHDLHIWEITSGEVALSAHVLVEPGGDCHTVRTAVQADLRAGYGITHATLEVCEAPGELVGVGSGEAGGRHCEDPHGTVHRRAPEAG